MVPSGQASLLPGVKRRVVAEQPTIRRVHPAPKPVAPPTLSTLSTLTERDTVVEAKKARVEEGPWPGYVLLYAEREATFAADELTRRLSPNERLAYVRDTVWPQISEVR